MPRQPRLNASISELAELYANKMAVTAKELRQTFNISDSTSYKVVEYIYDYADKNGRVIYSPPTQRLVPTDILFEAYGWDPKQIIERAKLLKKIS